MIYLPKRAVFIHIPRAGGNSITNAIASTCAGNGVDIIIGTSSPGIENWYNCNRHVNADTLKKLIDEWDTIFKFAIYRPEEDRVDSLKRLIQKEIDLKVFECEVCEREWRNILISDSEARQKYIDDFRKMDWNFFTKDELGNDIGVRGYDFYKLNEVWPEICDNCKIPRCLLPRLNSTTN